MLWIDNLEKSFRNQPILRGISFSVQPGEVVALIGPNGAGKTTTLRICTGALSADGGAIRVGDQTLSDDPQKAKSSIGVAPQGQSYYPFLTGRENLTLAGTLRELSGAELIESVDSLLGRFSLAEAADKLAREYSEGMGQKLAIAIAAIGTASILIFDESLNGLDPRSLVEAKKLIHERAAEGTGILLTTHILPLVEEMASKVICLHQGQVQHCLEGDEWEEIRSSKNRLEELYLIWTEPTDNNEETP